jgi:hypothetical protein
MPKKTRNSGKKSGESTKAMNRRALLKRIGAGIALTAAGPTLDLGLSAQQKKGKDKEIKLIENEELKILDLSYGTIRLVGRTGIVSFDPKARTLSVRCPLGTPVPDATPTPDR